ESLADRVTPGAQVLAPFRGRPRRGFVVELAGQSQVERVESLASVLDREAVTPHLLALAHWISEYYLAPLGEVLGAMLPGGLEGFAGSRARRSAVEDPHLRLVLPERVTLTEGQRLALRAAEEALDARRFAPLLLHGVTASGK